MSNLEWFLTVAVVLALAGLVVVGFHLQRCVQEMRSIRDHLSVLEEDTSGQFEVLDRLDRVIQSRKRALRSEGDLEDGPPPDRPQEQPRVGPRNRGSNGL